MRAAGRFLFTISFLLLAAQAMAQLTAHAGPDKSICPGVSVVIGGTPVSASGGQPPYTYNWYPATGLNSTSIANPTASPTTTTNYVLQVTDDTGAVALDYVTVTASPLNQVTAGSDTSICERSFATLGGPDNSTSSGVIYRWVPGSTLNDSTLANPVAAPASTTTYTLTASAAGCPDVIDAVMIVVIPTPAIDAGMDTTIQEGATATLHATGAYFYAWGPIDNMTYYYTANPNAEPIVTTTYYLYGEDETGKCPAYDSVTVFVEPNDAVVIYNTFTPNLDGDNDTWYIGNIQKYPDNRLEVYNRTGKLVYKANNYLNSWDGKAFGQDLPATTYFYVLDLGMGKEVLHGTVTIIR